MLPRQLRFCIGERELYAHVQCTNNTLPNRLWYDCRISHKIALLIGKIHGVYFECHECGTMIWYHYGNYGHTTFQIIRDTTWNLTTENGSGYSVQSISNEIPLRIRSVSKNSEIMHCSKMFACPISTLLPGYSTRYRHIMHVNGRLHFQDGGALRQMRSYSAWWHTQYG